MIHGLCLKRPDFGNQDGWLLAPDGTASHFYSLSLAHYDRKELLAELGDTLISLERPVPPRKIFSPNGAMYAYTGATGEPVKVYSTDGEVLAQAGPIRSQGSAWAFGWAPNGRAVYLSVYYPGFPNEAEPLFLLHLPEK